MRTLFSKAIDKMPTIAGAGILGVAAAELASTAAGVSFTLTAELVSAAVAMAAASRFG